MDNENSFDYLIHKLFIYTCMYIYIYNETKL